MYVYGVAVATTAAISYVVISYGVSRRRRVQVDSIVVASATVAIQLVCRDIVVRASLKVDAVLAISADNIASDSVIRILDIETIQTVACENVVGDGVAGARDK